MLFTLIIYCYFLTIGQLDYVLPLRVGFSCHLLMYYSVFLCYVIFLSQKNETLFNSSFGIQSRLQEKG